MRAAVTGSLVAAGPPLLTDQMSRSPMKTASSHVFQSSGHDLNRHRFGVNYTPTKNWWFCWNEWNADPIKRDLDGIAFVGADHMRILLIWPYFQPNPTWISSVHLERLDQLLTLMGERNLDAVVTVFTGQLSGWFFLPPFNQAGSAFYTDDAMWTSQELFMRQLARVMGSHKNIIGFDIGNEINTCWSTEPRIGDLWMAKMISLMKTVYPEGVNVNGVDEAPWLESTTFSPQALAALPMPTTHCYPYWSGALKYGDPMDPPSIKLLAAMATLVRSYANDARKPVWAEEFNTCIESMTEKQQAEWLEKPVLAAIDLGVSWFTYWLTHQRRQGQGTGQSIQTARRLPSRETGNIPHPAYPTTAGPSHTRHFLAMDAGLDGVETDELRKERLNHSNRSQDAVFRPAQDIVIQDSKAHV